MGNPTGNTIYPSSDLNDEALLGEMTGSAADKRDMNRLGKEQLFKRKFGFASTFGFALIIMSTWETILSTVAFGLGNGGPGGLIWTFVAAWLGFILVSVSMAEMASMAPTSGGQYHWVSEFAPSRVQKSLSYFVGWLSILGYQVRTAIGAFVAGTMIQGLIILNYPNYYPERWHGSLVAMAISICVALFNVFLAPYLPLTEGLILVSHFAGYFVILVPLWVLAPRTPSSVVWTSFVDGGSWGNLGVSCLVGMITNVGALVGGDAAAYVAEEVKSASKMLPRAMISTTIVNGFLGFVMLVTVLYTLGDLKEDLSSPTGYPIIQVFYTATSSAGGATGLGCVLIILSVCSNLTTMAASSRQLFSFARDKGVPCHEWVSRVPRGYDVPVAAIMVSTTLACVFHFIYMVSFLAFNIIMSVGTVALLMSYIVSIATITWKRVRGHHLLPSKLNLGKLGLPVNLTSLCFCTVVFVFAFFPPLPNPAAAEMNWAIAVYGGMLLLASTYYVLRARHVYVGPVAYVRKAV